MKKITLFLLLTFVFSQNYSLEFDGVDDYVNIGRPLSMYSEDNASISLWFNTTIFPEERGMLMTNDTQPSNPQFGLIVVSDGKLRIEGSDSNDFVETNFPVNDGNWHHAVFIKNGNILELYVDGNPIGSQGVSPNMDTGDAFFIGAERTNGQRAYEGYIDEINIFNKVLNSSEIAELYNFSNNVVDGLVCYYNFNEGSGTTLTDQTANGNNGTIYGDPIWVLEDIEGCTDSTACNYDDTANVENGSCTYAEENFDCDGNCIIADCNGDGIPDDCEEVYDAGAQSGDANLDGQCNILDIVILVNDIVNGTFY